MKRTTPSVIPREGIESRIYLLRGEKVMLSTDLARLYQVAPRVLVQAVKRNSDRFPDDFMFQLTALRLLGNIDLLNLSLGVMN